jgi:hypothetical protein
VGQQGRSSNRYRQRRCWVIGAVATLAIATALVWTLVGNRPLVSNPLRRFVVPGYLDASDPRVAGAAAESRTVSELLAHVRDAIDNGMPATSALWSSGSSPQFESDRAVKLWRESRSIQILSYEPFTIPEDPSWSEDPHHNLSWQTTYQSLAWLLAPAGAYRASADPRYLQQVRHYLLDWIADTPPKGPPSTRSWFDGSVGYRSEVIVRLFKPVLSRVLSPSEVGVVLRALEQHGKLLESYLSETRFIGHNHLLFHCLQLYSLAVAFPELSSAATWRVEARARINSLIPEMVDTREGVSLEQAARYHLLVLGLLADADAFLRLHADGFTSGERSTLDRMASFAALLLTPSMTMPAIGDTGYGYREAVVLLEDLRTRGVSTPTSEFILSHGMAGRRPAAAYFYPSTGYAVIRPSYTPGNWASDLQLIVDTSPRSKPHGHDDAMSVILSAFGGPLLIDSGGPYRYGDVARRDFFGSLAHNMAVVGDGSDRQGTVAHLFEDDHPGSTVVAATVEIGGKALDRRAVVLLKPNTLVIVDLLQATDGRSHPYQLLYHLPPGSSVTHDGLGGVVNAGPAAMGFQVATESAGVLSVVEGQHDPLLGWVTHGVIGFKRPAPVLEFAQHAKTAWYVTAIQPAFAGDASIPSLDVREGPAGALQITVTANGQSSIIVVDRDGGVQLPF